MDTILVADHYAKGESLKWYAFLLNELFETCEDVYKRRTNLILSYLIMTLEMWKWFPLLGRDLAQIFEDQPYALKYTPWRTLGDPKQKINEAAFSEWYGKMIGVIRVAERIPREFLDEYLEVIWFGVTHGNTFLRPHYVHPVMFQM